MKLVKFEHPRVRSLSVITRGQINGYVCVFQLLILTLLPEGVTIYCSWFQEVGIRRVAMNYMILAQRAAG